MTAGPRRGVALPVVMALLLIAGVAVFTLHQLQRQRYLEAHRHSFGAIALNLAESGLNAGLERVWDAIERPGDPLYQALVDRSAAELAGAELPVELPVQELLREVLGPEASIEFRVVVPDARPFHEDDAHGGLRADPREKTGTLAVDSIGTFRGVTRRIRTARNFKLVWARAPVLSKFTLFARGHTDAHPNLLAYDRRRPAAALQGPDGPARPLVLYHDDRESPVVGEGTFFPTAVALEERLPDEAGLVFLGGDPWYLNLNHGTGAGPFDELHLLRRTRYALADAPEHLLWFGLYSGALHGSAMRPGGPSSPGPSRPDGTPVPEGTAALRLSGDVAQLSPTVVLGPAFRSYLRVRLDRGLWYPRRTRAEFSASPQAGRMSYAEYRRHMAEVVHEPYNRSVDFLATNEESIDTEGLVDAGGTPPEPSTTLGPEATHCLRPSTPGNDAFLYPSLEDRGAPLQLIRPMPTGDEVLFQGDLQELDAAAWNAVMRAKVVATVADQAELESRFLVEGVYELPGVVLVERGPVVLGKRVNGEAAVLLVDGPIQVDGWLRKANPAATLALVSLRGDLSVTTGAPVQASLIALGGRVLLGPGQIDLLGSVAAGGLDLARMIRGEEVKRLRFDEELDPTHEARYRRALRLFLDDRVRVEIAGARDT